MTFPSKHILIVLLCLALLGGGLSFGYQRGHTAAVEKYRTRVTELEVNFDKELGRAKTEVVRRDEIIEALKGRRDDLLKDIAERDGQIRLMGEGIARLKTSGGGKVKVKTVIRRVETPVERPMGPIKEASEDPDWEGFEEVECQKYGYSDFRLDSVLNTCEEPPTLQYHLSQSFKLHLVEAETPEGSALVYAELNEIDPDGNIVSQMEIEDFKVLHTSLMPEPRWHWWAPHLDVGLMVGMDFDLKPTASASIGLTAGGYGITEDDQEWRYLRAGLDISETSLGMSLAPIGANLGKLGLPLVSDLWLWPTYKRANEKNSLGLVLSTTL